MIEVTVRLRLIFCLTMLLLNVGSAFGEIYFSEDWETGTPPANWPCKTIGTACNNDLSFNGWTGRSHTCNDSGGALSGISTTQANSGTKSFYQHRPAGQYYTCDLFHAMPAWTTVHVRYYLFLTTNWNDFPVTAEMHWPIYMNSTGPSLVYNFSVWGSNFYSCAGKKIIMIPNGVNAAGDSREQWAWHAPPQEDESTWALGNADDPVCQVDYADYIGRWVSIEYRFEINQVNKRVTLTEWIDGVHKRGPVSGPGGQTFTFTNIIFSGYENSAANWVNDFYIDDIVISDSYIGPISPTSVQGLTIQGGSLR